MLITWKLWTIIECETGKGINYEWDNGARPRKVTNPFTLEKSSTRSFLGR